MRPLQMTKRGARLTLSLRFERDPKLGLHVRTDSATELAHAEAPDAQRSRPPGRQDEEGHRERCFRGSGWAALLGSVTFLSLSPEQLFLVTDHADETKPHVRERRAQRCDESNSHDRTNRVRLRGVTVSEQ